MTSSGHNRAFTPCAIGRVFGGLPSRITVCDCAFGGFPPKTNVYKLTVHDLVFGGFPAKKNVYTP